MKRPPEGASEDDPVAAEAKSRRRELRLLAIAFGCALLIVGCLGVSAAVLGVVLDAQEAAAP